MNYQVVKNFQDKYTKEYYGIGFTYETDDQERANDLERGGFIVPEGQEMVQVAENIQKNETVNQANVTNKASNKTAAENEAYTVVNGKRVTLKEAEAQAQAKEANVKKTGITQNENNSSEPVQAGKVVQNKQTNEAPTVKGKHK